MTTGSYASHKARSCYAIRDPELVLEDRLTPLACGTAPLDRGATELQLDGSNPRSEGAAWISECRDQCPIIEMMKYGQNSVITARNQNAHKMWIFLLPYVIIYILFVETYIPSW